MGILKSCCCFGNVRTGSIACAIYSMVISLVFVGISSYNIYLYDATMHLDTGQLEPFNDSASMNDSQVYWEILDGKNSSFLSERLWFVFFLMICVPWFFSSALLLVGINREQKALLLPWICLAIANIVLDTISLIYQCTNLSLLIFNIIHMVVWLCPTLLNGYCVLCVISQYQELKAGRGTLQYLRHQRLQVLYQPGIQQINVTQGPIFVTGGGGSGGTPVVTPAVQHTRVTTGERPIVTATVMVSPPDYTVASSCIPQYQEAESLLRGEGAGAETDPKPKGSPPPPYTP